MRLAKLRKEKRYSQVQLSILLNVSQSSISSFEIGERIPDLKTLIELSKIFNVSIDYLAGISDIRNPILNSELTPQEIEHLNIYKKLNQTQKDKTEGFMLSFIHSQ